MRQARGRATPADSRYRLRVRRPAALPLFALWLLAPAAGAASVEGMWRLPMGSVQVSQSPDGLVGKLVEPARDCAALERGAEVLRGSLLEGTFSGEIRLCLQGPRCVAKESWLSVLLLQNGRGDRLSGAVERGNADCHAQLPGKGGLVMRKSVPGEKRADAQARIPKDTLTRAQAELSRGGALLEAGQFEEARHAFEKAAAVAPLPEAYNGMGVTHYARQEYPEALEAYRQAVAADPDFGDAYYNMACVYAVTGKKDLAFKFLELAAKDRFHDIATLDDDDDLKSLRDDPRYAAWKYDETRTTPEHTESAIAYRGGQAAKGVNFLVGLRAHGK